MQCDDRTIHIIQRIRAMIWNTACWEKNLATKSYFSQQLDWFFLRFQSSTDCSNSIILTGIGTRMVVNPNQWNREVSVLSSTSHQRLPSWRPLSRTQRSGGRDPCSPSSSTLFHVYRRPLCIVFSWNRNRSIFFSKSSAHNFQAGCIEEVIRKYVAKKIYQSNAIFPCENKQF